jgi:hypothetical protein
MVIMWSLRNKDSSYAPVIFSQLRVKVPIKSVPKPDPSCSFTATLDRQASSSLLTAHCASALI